MSEAISSLSREIIPRPANESFQTAGDLKMRVDRGAFELSHGEYLTSLAQALAGSEAKDLQAETLALIARESRFDTDARSRTGSKGVMQLTSHPFNDMSYEYTVSVRDTSDQDADGNTRERITDERAGRADKFVPYFAQIADIALTTQGVSDALKTLCTLAQQYPNGMPKALQNTWDDAVTRLKKEVYNPVSNIATGMVYHRFLHESSDPRRGWGEFEKQLTAVTERPGAINKLQSMLKEVQIAMSDSEIIQTLKGFRNKAQKDPDVVKDFIALRGYNGQQNGDKGGIEHRYLYALNIMIAKEIEYGRLNARDTQIARHHEEKVDEIASIGEAEALLASTFGESNNARSISQHTEIQPKSQIATPQEAKERGAFSQKVLDIADSLRLSSGERSQFIRSTGEINGVFLSEAPFKDMSFAHRGERYKSLLSQIAPIISTMEGVPESLRQLTGLSRVENISSNPQLRRQWESLVEELIKERKNPHINAVVGMLYARVS